MTNYFFAYRPFKDYLKSLERSAIIIITDSKVRRYCLPILFKKIPALKTAVLITIPAGEQSKTIEQSIHIWQQLAKAGADRKSLVINIGGGVISDLGGFAASTYFRGLPCINIPTSLMAMADAAIGGKTGINVNHYKNQVGTFSLPLAVAVFSELLKTLPHDHLQNGFAEMLKHALLKGGSHFDKICNLRKLDCGTLQKMIPESLEFKKQCIEADFKENGLRKTLNFGHTIGHAIETREHLKDNKMMHGQAVACGMWMETMLSLAYADLPVQDANLVFQLIETHFGYKKFTLSDKKAWLKIMLHDKKNEKQDINFTLLRRIGHPIINRYLSPKQIRDVIYHY